MPFNYTLAKYRIASILFFFQNHGHTHRSKKVHMYIIVTKL